MKKKIDKGKSNKSVLPPTWSCDWTTKWQSPRNWITLEVQSWPQINRVTDLLVQGHDGGAQAPRLQVPNINRVTYYKWTLFKNKTILMLASCKDTFQPFICWSISPNSLQTFPYRFSKIFLLFSNNARCKKTHTKVSKTWCQWAIMLT